jgi:tetratricopeptide (TPR) repeat protein
LLRIPTSRVGPVGDTDHQRGESASIAEGGDFSEAIKLDPKNPLPYYHRGITIRQDRQQAIRDLTKAIELAPRVAKFHGWRGKFYENIGDKERAIVDYRSAVSIDPADNDIVDRVQKLSAKR